MTDAPSPTGAATRRILVAELLAVGTELTVGETTDTNSGELARSLVAHGVGVSRVANLPDDLGVVADALRSALTRADLVVTTGGLGPTPDDLTREAVAEVCDEDLTVDEAALALLRGLWARRGQPFPSVNVKQAWVIPSATPLPNPNGTAPGWWVDRPDGRVIVTLPGPPREMRAMWADEVLPRLAGRGVGADLVVRTLRLHGVGESQVAEVLGEALLREVNPIVATYARHEAVDVRISARAAGDRSAESLADEAEAVVDAALGRFVWARGATTWAAALGEALATRGWTLATSERGTAGALVTLLRGLEPVRLAQVANAQVAEAPASAGHVADARASDARVATGSVATGPVNNAPVANAPVANAPVADTAAPSEPAGDAASVIADARAVRTAAGADVGFAIQAIARSSDTRVLIGIVTPEDEVTDERLAFQRGNQGADRAAIAGTAVLLETLRAAKPPG